MKITNIPLIIIALIFILMFTLTSCGESVEPPEEKSINNEQAKNNSNIDAKEKKDWAMEDIVKKYNLSANALQNSDLELVKDEKIAVEIAEIVLINVYGKEIKEKFPLIVNFDSEFNVWILEGQLKKGTFGGIPYVVIKKKDGQVVYLSHSK